MEFKNRIVMIVYGVVAQALLPMLVKHLRVLCATIVVIDFVDRTAVLQPWIEKGLRFCRERVTPFSLARLLSTHVRAGDLIVNLAWSVDFFDIVQWAHDNEVLYINASLESWDPTAEMHRKPTLEKSLYTRYAKLLPLIEKWRGGTTAVVDHGANPVDLNPVYTTLRTEDGGTLQVPNNLFFQKAVKRQAPAALANPQPLTA